MTEPKTLFRAPNRDGYWYTPNLGDMERNLELLNLFYRAADTAFFNPEVSDGKR